MFKLLLALAPLGSQALWDEQSVLIGLDINTLGVAAHYHRAGDISILLDHSAWSSQISHSWSHRVGNPCLVSVQLHSVNRTHMWKHLRTSHHNDTTVLHVMACEDNARGDHPSINNALGGESPIALSAS